MCLPMNTVSKSLSRYGEHLPSNNFLSYLDFNRKWEEWHLKLLLWPTILLSPRELALSMNGKHWEWWGGRVVK